MKLHYIPVPAYEGHFNDKWYTRPKLVEDWHSWVLCSEENLDISGSKHTRGMVEDNAEILGEVELPIVYRCGGRETYTHHLPSKYRLAVLQLQEILLDGTDGNGRPRI